MHWNPETFTSSSTLQSESRRKNKQYNYLMGEDSHKCTYTFNEFGFRGDSITKDGIKIMSLGCSLTEGYGVNDNETWSHYLSQLIPNGVNLNFGVSSRSNDFITRTLITYFDIIKPDIVIVNYTFITRKEYIDEINNIESTMIRYDYTKFGSTDANIEKLNAHIELSNVHADLNNWYKNHLLIKNFLENKKCKWVWDGSLIMNDSVQEFNRVDSQFLNENNNYLDYAVDNLHPGPLTNKRYSELLFKFILEHYPELSVRKPI